MDGRSIIIALPGNEKLTKQLILVGVKVISRSQKPAILPGNLNVNALADKLFQS